MLRARGGNTDPEEGGRTGHAEALEARLVRDGLVGEHESALDPLVAVAHGASARLDERERGRGRRRRRAGADEDFGKVGGDGWARWRDGGTGSVRRGGREGRGTSRTDGGCAALRCDHLVRLRAGKQRPGHGQRRLGANWVKSAVDAPRATCRRGRRAWGGRAGP